MTAAMSGGSALTWEGLVGLVLQGVAPQGELDGPGGTAPWNVPAVVHPVADDPLWGESIAYLVGPFEPSPVPDDRKGMLTQFVDLAEAELDEIAAFAARWGHLGGACEHGHLVSLNARNAVTLEHQRHPIRHQVLEHSTWAFEPASEWRALARDVGGLLDRAGRLQFPGPQGDDPELIATMNELLQSALLAPALVPVERDATGVVLQYRMSMQPRTLWSAVVLAAATRIIGVSTAALAICAGCQSEFSPKNRKQIYCGRCNERGVPEALRQRRHRAKLRAEI